MTAITEIQIEHYKGFYKRQTIAPARPNGSLGSGLTVLVGPNNSGKTSVLNAVRLVVNPRQVDMEHRHDGLALKISLVVDAGYAKSVTNPDLGATLVLDGESNLWPSIHDFRIVPSRRSWSPYTGQQTMDIQGYWNSVFNRQTGEGDDNYFVSRVASLPPNERTQMDTLLKELLPQLNTWKIELSRNQTFILYETKSGAKHSSDLFGDGMASIFRVALALIDSDDGDIVAIDEPELSLHPQAQKALASVLSRFSSNRQIIVTTHSPYFVSWADLANGAKVYRLTQKKDGVAVGSLESYTLENLKGLVDDWQKPNLLDAVAREIFFSEEVVFLEGQEDVGLLRKFCDERRVPTLSAFGYGAGGFGNIKHFLDMAEDLGIPAAAVYDGDHAATAAAMANEFPDALIKTLTKPDMRDKPARDAKGYETAQIAKEGIFDRAGTIKPEHEQYLLALVNEIAEFLRSKA